MTCGVEFISSDQTRPIATYNIRYSNFDRKIPPEEPVEIIKAIYKQFIEKIWEASIEHDYIPAEYGMLLMLVDSVRITP